MSHPTKAAFQNQKKSGIKSSLWFNLLLALGLLSILYFLFFSSLSFITRHGDDTKVPKVIGSNMTSAIKLLEDQGFEVHVDSTFLPEQKALLVLDQMPEVGELVKHGRTLFITVNKSVPPTTPMPNLVNLSFRSAELIIKSNRLVLGDTTFRPDIAQGAVLEQLLNGQPIRPGQMVPQGSRISLVIGDGLGNTEMNVPDVIGLTFPAAVAQLNGSGLQFTAVFDADVKDTINAKVYQQTPNAISDLGSPSRIRQGDFIDLFISQMPSDSLMSQNRNAWKEHMFNPPPSAAENSDSVK